MHHCERQSHQDLYQPKPKEIEGFSTYPSFVGPIEIGSIDGVADGICEIALFIFHRPGNSVWRRICLLSCHHGKKSFGSRQKSMWVSEVTQVVLDFVWVSVCLLWSSKAASSTKKHSVPGQNWKVRPATSLSFSLSRSPFPNFTHTTFKEFSFFPRLCLKGRWMITEAQGSKRIRIHPVSHKGQTQWNQSSRQTLLQILTAVASTHKFSRKRGKAGVSHLVQLAKCRHWQCSQSQECLKFKPRKCAGLRGRRRRPRSDTRDKKGCLTNGRSRGQVCAIMCFTWQSSARDPNS